MIKLEDIALREVIYYFDNKEIRDLIKEMELYTIADVIDLMELHPEYNWDNIKDRISEVKKVINKYNNHNVKPVKYETREYYDRTLNYTDSQNNATVLLLANPTLEIQTRYRGLHMYNMEQLKHDLSLTKKTGVNAVISSVRNVGEGNILNILDAIEMYTTQVERQAALTNERDINVFKYNSLEKQEIVTNKYEEIINYFLNNADTLVWGNLTDKQRELYKSSIENSRKLDNIIKERMIEIVSNYTTLPELDDVVSGDYKVLKRFIKK